MPSEHFQPREALCISGILNALDLNREVVTEEPELYSVVPGNNGPRWIIPAASRASASVLSTWRPYSFPAQVKWFLVRMAARAGRLQLLPSVSSLRISRKTSTSWFKRCGIAAQAGEMFILVGNPSRDRKLIIFLLNDAHRIAAVLKVGLTTGGRSGILREAEVLGKLEQYGWAPEVLSVHPDLGAAAQEFVHGTMADRGFRSEYLSLLCQLPQSGASLNLTSAANALAVRLRPYVADTNKIAPNLLDRCLSCLNRDVAVPTILVHGDFAPWNIRKTSESGYALVDWEWANFAGLPLQDLLHFHFSEDRLFGGKGGGYAAIRKKAICAEYLKRMDLNPNLFPRLTIAYLLEQFESDCKEQDRGATADYLLHQLAMVIESLGLASSSGDNSL